MLWKLQCFRGNQKWKQSKVNTAQIFTQCMRMKKENAILDDKQV